MLRCYTHVKVNVSSNVRFLSTQQKHLICINGGFGVAGGGINKSIGKHLSRSSACFEDKSVQLIGL